MPPESHQTCMVESHPSQGAASVDSAIPDKYVPDKRRSVDRTDYGTLWFGLSTGGYEIIPHKHLGDKFTAFIHRLVAVAEHGYESVDGKIVHHKNGVPWDNRPENIELLTVAEHNRKHQEDLITARWRG